MSPPGYLGAIPNAAAGQRSAAARELYSLDSMK